MGGKHSGRYNQRYGQYGRYPQYGQQYGQRYGMNQPYSGYGMMNPMQPINPMMGNQLSMYPPQSIQTGLPISSYPVNYPNPMMSAISQQMNIMPGMYDAQPTLLQPNTFDVQGGFMNPLSPIPVTAGNVMMPQFPNTKPIV